MAKLSFPTFIAANNVIAQLPPEARGHGAGTMLAEKPGDGWELTVPDEFEAAARAADPDREPPQPTEKQARAECARRIGAFASEATQRNLAGYMAMIALKPNLTTQDQSDVAAFGQAMQWISDMRGAWRALVANPDPAWRDDSKWPVTPQAAVDLAARF